MQTEPRRCGWAVSDQMKRYHDDEWGVPAHDDRKLFEFLLLEGAQAGLSWATILKRREGYRAAFADFDVEAVARFSERKIERLLTDTGIIRNRLKVAGAVRNAKAFLAVRKEFGSFDTYIWQFAPAKPRRSPLRSTAELPARTEESDAMSRDLKKRGFTFVGSTICYAYMQAMGLVNDHIAGCYREKGSGGTVTPS